MTWPQVTEQPLSLEPTSKDTFLDGLAPAIRSGADDRPPRNEPGSPVATAQIT